MKKIRRIVALGMLGYLAVTGASSALAQDPDDCRGGYRMMLMTTAECQAYLQQLKEVRARSDRLAQLELREWHTSLLIERAEACPCRAGEHFVLYQRGSGPQRTRKSLSNLAPGNAVDSGAEDPAATRKRIEIAQGGDSWRNFGHRHRYGAQASAERG